MEQRTENKINPASKFINFYNYNKLKLLAFFSIIIIGVLILLFINYQNKNRNIQIAEKYVTAVIYLSSNDKDNARIILEDIILSKNKFYSLVALNNIIEKKLIKDKNKILEYFEILEKLNHSKETKDLLSLKKALFLIKNSDVNYGKKILKQLIKKDSSVKLIAEELLKK